LGDIFINLGPGATWGKQHEIQAM